jgi:glutamate N-acetyltransferase/amino-acid N-acetyltransferase
VAVNGPAWPVGVRGAGAACGVKADGSADLGVLVADGPVSWAGTFTKNAAAAAPVRWCRARLGGRVRAIVVNSGNANACTGPAGDDAVTVTVDAAASALGCSPDEVLVASTGPIGVPLPVERIARALPTALADAQPDTASFANAILTTDTRPKITERRAGPARVVGVAKGAAMLAPNMATMLAFVATDAAVDDAFLQSALSHAVGRTFDRISVDACESTNDSVFLVATGRVPGVDDDAFAGAVEAACADLAEQMVRDAEGGSKLVRIRVEGAPSEEAAAALGRAVASSVLWRAALYGGDPNWGRVLAALGAAARSLDPRSVTLSIGDEVVFARGVPAGSLELAAKHMAGDDVWISCVVGRGPGRAQVLTSDLSADYVTLNAFGTT